MPLIAPGSYETLNKWIIVYFPPPPQKGPEAMGGDCICRLSVLLMLTTLCVPCKWKNADKVTGMLLLLLLLVCRLYWFLSPSVQVMPTASLWAQWCSDYRTRLQVSLYLSDPGVCCLSQVGHWAPDYAHFRQPVVSLCFLYKHRKLLFYTYSPAFTLPSLLIGSGWGIVTGYLADIYVTRIAWLQKNYILRMRATTKHSKWRTPEDFIGQEAIIFSHDFHLFGADLLHRWSVRLLVRHFRLISLLVVVPFKTSNHRRKLRRVHAKILR